MLTVVIWHRLVPTCCWYLISREVMGVMSCGSWPLLWLTCHPVPCCKQQPWAVRLTIASEHCWYSSVPLSLIPQHPSLLPLSPFYWCFPASSSLPPMVGNPPPCLTAVVNRQYLLYELLFLPGELLLEQEAAKCQSMLEACVEGFRWSPTEKWDMQCMVLGWGDEWDFLCRSHRLGKRGSLTGGGCRTKRVCSEMSPLIGCMHVYAQHFSLAELSPITCGLLMWKYGNPHCL